MERRRLLQGSVALPMIMALPSRGRAAAADPVKIGVLSDMSGPFADNAGPGSVVAVRLALEDFARVDPAVRVELVSADMLNRPDVGLGLARHWYDAEGVDAIVDVPASAVALSVATLTRERDKVALFSGAATSDLTRSACSPNQVQWTYDTWSMAHATAAALLKEKRDRWFFLTADNALGQSLERDASDTVVRNGGQVVGSRRYPFPSTSDFSSYLLEASASGATVLGLANAGADTINAVKQASEFGVTRRGGGMAIAALLMNIADVHAMGLEEAGGLYLSNAFYWDMDVGARDFAARFAARNGGAKPSQLHAGAYASVLHYLKAVSAMGMAPAKASGAACVARMKAIPTDDPLFGRGLIRADGRTIHDMYLFQVKTQAESRGPWDYLQQRQRVPGADAFQPMLATCSF